MLFSEISNDIIKMYDIEARDGLIHIFKPAYVSMNFDTVHIEELKHALRMKIEDKAVVSLFKDEMKMVVTIF